jgi:hypothetical protein
MTVDLLCRRRPPQRPEGQATSKAQARTLSKEVLLLVVPSLSLALTALGAAAALVARLAHAAWTTAALARPTNAAVGTATTPPPKLTQLCLQRAHLAPLQKHASGVSGRQQVAR